jgi:cell division protein FtsL
MAKPLGRRREILIWLLLALAAVTVLSFYIWHQTRSYHLGIDISRLEFEIKSLEKEVERLEVEKASLEALDRVEKIARERLNLAPPRPEQMIDLRKPASSGEGEK